MVNALIEGQPRRDLQSSESTLVENQEGILSKQTCDSEEHLASLNDAGPEGIGSPIYM